MIIGRLFKKRGSLGLSLAACLAFILAAILAWDLPLSEAMRFAMASLLALIVIMFAAALTVVTIHLLADLWRKIRKRLFE